MPRDPIPTLTTGTSLAATDSDKASLLSQHFESVYLQTDSKPHTMEGPFPAKLADVDCDAQFVYLTLKNLSNKYSTGPDLIPLVFYKNLAPFLAEPLSILFRKCLDSGQIPRIWSHSIVTPVYKKKGTKSDPKNWRPISNTCCLCRILERHIGYKLKKYLECNKLLSTDQFGYREKRSTETNLLLATNEWTQLLDQGQSVAVVYTDMKAAFDTVDRGLLLERLAFIGISGNLLRLLEAFLSNRTMQVRVGSELSDSVVCRSGVPQGTVLGPILWNIFYDPLASQIHNSSILRYADDAKIFRSITCPNDLSLLQADLDRLANWCSDNQVRVSESKCEVLTLGPYFSNNHINLSLNGIQLPVVDKARDLGVWVDNKLSFANHAASAASKASRVSAVVFRTFTNRDPFFYRLAYLGYVRPILLYNSTVFNSHSAKADNLLEHIQQAFTRKIFWRCHLPKTSYEERLAFLDLDKLCVEREAIDLTTIHKLFHLEGGERSEFSDALLVMHDQGERRSARVSNQFQLRSDFNTALRRKSLNNRAKSRWNSLPTNLMSLKPDSFKDNVLKIIRSPITRPSNVKSLGSGRRGDEPN